MLQSVPGPAERATTLFRFSGSTHAHCDNAVAKVAATSSAPFFSSTSLMELIDDDELAFLGYSQPADSIRKEV